MTDLVLNIRAVEAKDLPVMDFGIGAKSDPYLLFKTSSSSKTFKTDVVRKNLEPRWDQSFTIPVTSLGHDNTLHIELFDWDRITRHDLISTRDFQIGTFPIGKVIDMWYKFYPAPNVRKPGNVHLVFHLANKSDTPFEEKFVVDERVSKKDIYVPPLTEEEIKNAKASFTEIDTNRNGYLEENELDSYFRQDKKELRCFPKLVVEIFGQNGHITVDQFLTFYKSLAEDKTSDKFIGRYIFNYIDKDKSGVIDSNEFQKVIDLLKFPPGFEQHPLKKGNMNYSQFSHEFYTILRMAWYGQLRDALSGQ